MSLTLEAPVRNEVNLPAKKFYDFQRERLIDIGLKIFYIVGLTLMMMLPRLVRP